MVARTAGASERLNVAEAKKRLADLLGRVADAGETILITHRGRPMAKLVPVTGRESAGLAHLRGWLDNDDPFFVQLDAIVATRSRHVPRVLESGKRRPPKS